MFIFMNTWIIGRNLMRCHYEDITGADFKHAKRVCKIFKIKNLGEYHDLYLQSDTLLLADVLNTF